MASKNYRPSNYTDKELRCVECNQTFTFTAGEQQYFAERDFRNPKRCPECREKRKREQASQGFGQASGR